MEITIEKYAKINENFPHQNGPMVYKKMKKLFNFMIFSIIHFLLFAVISISVSSVQWKNQQLIELDASLLLLNLSEPRFSCL